MFNDELVKRSQYLLEKLNYPWEMMPLMYVILKGADGDVQTAHRRIDEASSNPQTVLTGTVKCTQEISPFI
ncbi:hypothetical protein pipiens_015180 [Culex pipiens pipiens]|uniref:Doublesex dimerisation domain-containing protein n=1 Tax=Culex pipiens pipiens TaxID=38569 RepID=A0ABD1CRM4_CULPP